MIAAVVFLPLFAALVSGLFVRKISVRAAQTVTAGCMLLSAIAAAIVFHDVALQGNEVRLVLVEWLRSGTFHVDWVLRVDVLTAVMLIVVTWVSTVVHFYAIGYMDHDPHPQRFMCYLSLFTFFMLMLVTADNFIQLFLGWEGVGLCSYLLIGFWYKKDEANAAAMKAFLVNRVGDFGFALGIFAVFMIFGSVSFDEIFAQVPEKADDTFQFLGMEFHALTLAGLLLFIGCMGKSAQLGLHTWLPDAMEGPTPVSALIHAATMVTAGVFLVARCSPLYEYAPVALNVITVVGALTALFAATIGLVQNDIKKVIAYSTCSQLGYMFFACGVGAYSAAIFHLMTHAFFKALLFLGAGSVIHAMSGEQDMRKMGGIWKLIPVTYGFAWVGSLALAGIPPFAGFFSKDIILESAYAAQSGVGSFAFILGVAAAFLTAFYSWRLLFMTFHGKSRASHEVMHHVHESPKIMTLPLVLLVLGAIFSGILGMFWLGMVDANGDFWRGSIFTHPENEVLHRAHEVALWVKLLPLVMGVSGIALAWLFYIRKPHLPAKVAGTFRPLHTLFLNRWYFDEIYHAVFVRGAMALGRHFWKFWDTVVIDGLGPNGFARLSARLANRTSAVQTGYTYHYAFTMVAGLLALVTWLFVSFY
jgi:NADH-quinone oxidoreductase subunit L